MYFVVPFRIQRVDEVTEIRHRERAGKTERQRRFGHTTNKTVHVDGEGFLEIHGIGGQKAEVSVSPASLQSVVRKSEQFLNSTSEPTATIFTIANWKFGGLMGGVLTLFTVLYVVGYSVGFLKSMLMLLKRMLP